MPDVSCVLGVVGNNSGETEESCKLDPTESKGSSGTKILLDYKIFDFTFSLFVAPLRNEDFDVY